MSDIELLAERLADIQRQISEVVLEINTITNKKTPSKKAKKITKYLNRIK